MLQVEELFKHGKEDVKPQDHQRPSQERVHEGPCPAPANLSASGTQMGLKVKSWSSAECLCHLMPVSMSSLQGNFPPNSSMSVLHGCQPYFRQVKNMKHAVSESPVILLCFFSVCGKANVHDSIDQRFLMYKIVRYQKLVSYSLKNRRKTVLERDGN